MVKRKEIKPKSQQCHVLNIQKSTPIPTFDFKINNAILHKTEVFKDLGIFISDNLNQLSQWKDLPRIIAELLIRSIK